MWIFIRLVVLLIAHLARLLRYLHRPRSVTTYNGKAFYARGGSGKKQPQRVGVDFRVPVTFRLQAETGSDRFFKSIGYAREFQTGDAQFDHVIYIASDHPALPELLSANQALRKLTMNAIDSGYDRIIADGRYLWLEWASDTGAGDADIAQLDALHEQFKEVGRHIRFRRDPFHLRVIAVESVVWSLLVYGMTIVVESSFYPGDLHAELGGLAMYAALLSAAIFMLLFVIIRAVLGSSSRGHRILTESALVMLLGLPLTSMSLLSDINTKFDDSAAIEVSREVSRLYITTSRSRRGGTRRHYKVEFRDTPVVNEFTLPRTMELAASEWRRLPKSGHVVQRMGNGRLGLLWYRGFRP